MFASPIPDPAYQTLPGLGLFSDSLFVVCSHWPNAHLVDKLLVLSAVTWVRRSGFSPEVRAASSLPFLKLAPCP